MRAVRNEVRLYFALRKLRRSVRREKLSQDVARGVLIHDVSKIFGVPAPHLRRQVSDSSSPVEYPWRANPASLGRISIDWETFTFAVDRATVVLQEWERELLNVARTTEYTARDE